MVVGSVEKSCSMLVHWDRSGKSAQVKEALEGGDVRAKRRAMQQAIAQLLGGEPPAGNFITIIRYVLPSEDHFIQKLLLLYLEAIEKTDSAGKLLPEMILICQNLRNNLQHPNEFIRGCTLRFLCRIKEQEILQPLLPSIMSNLEHRHSYVRRAAIVCVHSIRSLPGGDHLLPDAAELIKGFLDTEQDLSARRNALVALQHADPDLALGYLMGQLDQLPQWGDILQLAVLDLVRTVCRTRPEDKSKFIKLLLALLNTPHASVMYECAGALVSLSGAPTAVRAAANAYCQLLVSQSDHSVRLIVLDRLADLETSHPEIMQELSMDLLRALSSQNMDIWDRTLGIVLKLLTPRNVEEVVQALKKELLRVQGQSKDIDRQGEFRQALVQSIHQCAMKFPEVAGSVVGVLLDFLADPNAEAALTVVFFMREIIETNDKLQHSIYEQLLDIFGQIRSSRVCSSALWIIGEYCNTAADVEAAMGALKSSLGALPLSESAAGSEDGEGEGEEGDSAPAPAPSQSRPVVLADGTYASQSNVVESDLAAASGLAGESLVPNVRTLLLGGDFFLGSVFGATLTKLVFKLQDMGASEAVVNRAAAQAMLYMTSILRLGKSSTVPHPIDGDSQDRLALSLHAVSGLGDQGREGAALQKELLLTDCRKSFARLIAEKQSREASQLAAQAKDASSQPDELIDFSHLKAREGLSQLEIEDSIATDLKRAMGDTTAEDAGGGVARLDRMVQLTGFSDSVYAEAYVTTHQYDIVLDVTVANRTADTLQNLCLELATMGDLKLVERPQNCTFAPYEQRHIRANIKVSSTETGVIFGNIVYESASGDRSVVVLNDIHIDIMDYITPAECPDVSFRNMWAEFEWENKVAINTTFSRCREFLDHIVESTNMKCLTPPSALEGNCGFLAANLYAKSSFGEDALVNVSVEELPDGRLAGYVRIRSKTQGIALSLGDKITLKQKGGA